MSTIEVENVGAIKSLTIPIPEDGGFVVLMGTHGTGKSTTLRAVESLVSGNGGIERRDGAIEGPICADCPARERLTCKSPIAVFNGSTGTGLKFEPEPYRVHLCARGRNRGISGWHFVLPTPVVKCSGREAAEVAT